MPGLVVASLAALASPLLITGTEATSALQRRVCRPVRAPQTSLRPFKNPPLLPDLHRPLSPPFCWHTPASPVWRRRRSLPCSPTVDPSLKLESPQKIATRRTFGVVAASQQALPSPSKEGSEPGTVKAWVQAIRPKTLSASLMPVLVGHALAYAEYRSADVLTSATFWLFAVLTQIGTNLHNDYADYVLGADTERRVGPARATQKGWISPGAMKRAATGTLLVAAAVGLSIGGGLPMALVILACIFGAVAYTGGPYPLGAIGLEKLSIAYAGLGDIFTMFYFGFVPVLSTYWLNTGTISPTAIGFSIIMGSFASAIITVNNLRDAETDRVIGKKTSAVRFGKAFARKEYSLLITAPYILLPIMWLLGWIPAPWLLPLAAIMTAYLEDRNVRKNEGSKLNKSLFGTARVQIIFTFLQLLAMYSPDQVRQGSRDFYERMFVHVDPILAGQLKAAIFFGAVYWQRQMRGQDPLYPYAPENDMD